ncbi:Hypothetical predicted protein [Mytilus galloprovincialis]|uniref:Uncharacterized protein n=1 Tax=Mytilus galloprovincialis TaxID=29158 RepID=A0A8B6CFT7_MYTGA|nr:Hypothetical predicted protein [Mytilus galloprovincialis]
MQHLVIADKIFVNARDKCDPEMAKIKAVIIRESERQPTWGEPLPKTKRYDLYRNRIPADFFYVASMVRAKDDNGYLQSAGFTTRSIAIAFQSSSLMIPPALSFRFISYCLYVWAVKTYGDTNKDMLFHRSGVFTIDSSLDMYIACEDERIITRLVHALSNTLIMRDVASSIYECLASALEKISQLYIRTSSDQTQTSDAYFITRICCNSPNNSCVLPDNDQAQTDQIWICPSHRIEHSIHTITSWIEEKEDEKCKPGCTGKYSLPFLIKLEMDFNTWEQISHRQNERYLVRLNQDILERMEIQVW